MQILSFPGLGIEEFELSKVAFSVLGRNIAWYGILITCGMILAVICGICIFGDLKKIRLALTSIIDFGFSGVFEFLLLFSILLFNIWLLFFCSRKKG